MVQNLLKSIAACGLAGMFLAVSGPQQEVLANARDVLTAVEWTGCTGYCVKCATGGHAAGTGGVLCEDGQCSGQDAGQGAGWHTSCSGGDNCTGHACQQSLHDAEDQALSAAALLGQLSEAVLDEDGHAIRDLLSANPRRLHYVASRHALQITACDGVVTAHYPMPAEAEALLME